MQVWFGGTFTHCTQVFLRGCSFPMQLQLGDVKHPCVACPHPKYWIRSPARGARVRSPWHKTCRSTSTRMHISDTSISLIVFHWVKGKYALVHLRTHVHTNIACTLYIIRILHHTAYSITSDSCNFTWVFNQHVLYSLCVQTEKNNVYNIRTSTFQNNSCILHVLSIRQDAVRHMIYPMFLTQ